MKRKLVPVRPAMTAIAAVIAFSSTPLLAQTADTSAAQSVPVVVAPPPPTVEPAAPAASAQTASPDVATPAPAQAEPQPAMKTMSTPVEHGDGSSATSSMTSGAGSASAAPRATAAPVAAPHVQARASVPAAPAARDDAPAAKTAEPAATDATRQPIAAPVAANPAPTPAASVTTTRNTTADDATLPIAIGLGVIAIGGAAFALRHRRRDEADELLLETPIEAAPVVAAEPATIAPRVAEPTPMAVAPVTAAAAEGPSRLPNGFDLSRFGRHARAAYLGPTPDNPSHSLKRRLKRASFFDQREREAAAAGNMREPVYPEARAAQAATAEKGQVTIRMAPGRKPSNFGYVPQR